MRPSAVLQHVQHIASLGLPDGVAIPEILATIEVAIPTLYASFFWTDPDGTATDVFAPADVLDQMARFSVDFLTLDASKEPTLDKVIAGGAVVDNASQLAGRYDLSRSVVLNEVMPGMGVGMGLDLVVRRDGAARGVLYLNRDARHPDFTAAERRLLAAMHPYVSHALNGAREASVHHASDSEAQREGIVIATFDGEIVSLAGDAQAMLAELEPGRSARRAGRTARDRLPPVLTPLIDRLADALAGRFAEPARLRLTGRWGEYRTRAYPRDPVAGGRSGEAVIVITHHVPRMVRMLRRVATLPLAPAERRVALAVAEGMPTAALARQLGISEQTLRGYLKSIYARTGVDGRESLADLIRSP